MKKIVVDGQMLAASDIEQMRAEVIGWRDSALEFGAENFDFVIVTTWLVGLLAGVVEQYPE